MAIYVPIVMYGLLLFYKNYIVYQTFNKTLRWSPISVQSFFLNSVQFLKYVTARRTTITTTKGRIVKMNLHYKLSPFLILVIF